MTRPTWRERIGAFLCCLPGLDTLLLLTCMIAVPAFILFVAVAAVHFILKAW
jgi:hypothetical protein